MMLFSTLPAGILPGHRIIAGTRKMRLLRPEFSTLLGQVFHDGARLEDGDGRAAAHRLVIHNRRHPAEQDGFETAGPGC
jgi:hypothetical protein